MFQKKGNFTMSNDVLSFSFRLRWQIIPLIITLCKRDIIGKYRQASLGSLYAIIQPLGYMLSFLLLGKVVGVNSEGIPMIIMLLTGLVPWIFFSNCISGSTNVIRMNGDIIKKMPINNEVFLFVTTIVAFVDFLVSSIVLIFFAIWYQVQITTALLWLPVIIGLLIFFTLGLCFIIATVGTIRTDIQFLLPFILQIWLFSSPILYPLSQVPDSIQGIYILNPMTGIIESFRSVIAYGHSPDLFLMMISLAYGIALIIIGLPLFRYYGQYYADVI